jgi:TonB-linked SusC/RagA family outer membrane protein
MQSHLWRLLSRAGAALALVPAIAVAQQQATTIAGRVTTDAGVPLQGASVTIPAIGVGGYSNQDGRYTFTVPATRSNGQQVRVTARRIGFRAMAVNLTLSGTTVTQDFALEATATEISGVVVTALGQSREKSQVGTAVQQVSSQQLTDTKAPDIMQQISGKVSGVQITGTGAPGGSSMITIRGSNSITGDNTPLFIVDGVPIVKANCGSGGAGCHGANPYGGWDEGTPLNDLNSSDIETMTVLKGPNAAALYGSRAANGVILITTKKGGNTGGAVHTELNSYYTMENPGILPTYQNQYGQGAGGQFEFVNGAGKGVNDGADQSWGPKLDGRTMGCTFVTGTKTYNQAAPCLQFTSPGAASPWIAHPDNVKDFFGTGHTTSATLAVSGGTDHANARLSAGEDNLDSYIPGTFLSKTNALLTGDLQVTPNLSTTATVNYIRNVGRNRPGQGYGNSILESFVWFGRQVDMTALKDNWRNSGAMNGGPAGREYNWNYNFHNNPYFLMMGNPENDARDRLISTVATTYKVFDWLSATGRVGSDWYRYAVNQDFSPADITGANSVGAGLNQSYNGAFTLQNEYKNETNGEGLLNANKDFGRLNVQGTFGGNIRKENYNWNQVSTAGISAPGIYNVSNAAIAPQNLQSIQQRQVNSLYGSASYTWNGWWTVEGTARNDWSSTLPKGQNSYFYPSVNTSVVLSDAIPALRNNVLSYLKVRGSLARVGNDALPYQLRTTYNGSPNKYNGLPQFSYSDVVSNAGLKPEITTSSEGGLEMSFLNGRANLDATYYAKTTRDQIFNVTVSNTTGFGSKAINAGAVANKGFEGLFSVIPVQTRNVQWTSTFNYARNRSKVVTLYPGVSTIILPPSPSTGWWYVTVEARQGQPYGSLVGNAYLRDSVTGQLLTSGGLTQAGPRQVLGNIQPNWTGGWMNTITYKRLTLSGLLDIHNGGSLWSITNWFGDYAGVLKSSLKGREVDWNNPGVLVKGLDQSTCGAGSRPTADGQFLCVGGSANTKTRTAEDYYQDIFPVNEGYIYNDTYVKLRELRIGIDLPQRWAAVAHSSSVNFAITGRNLYTWTKVPNVDPEVSYSTGNGTQGVEYGEIPNARTFGVSLRITP